LPGGLRGKPDGVKGYKRKMVNEVGGGATGVPIAITKTTQKPPPKKKFLKPWGPQGTSLVGEKRRWFGKLKKAFWGIGKKKKNSTKDWEIAGVGGPKDRTRYSKKERNEELLGQSL